jgi:hypothetical protein
VQPDRKESKAKLDPKESKESKAKLDPKESKESKAKLDRKESKAKLEQLARTKSPPQPKPTLLASSTETARMWVARLRVLVLAQM